MKQTMQDLFDKFMTGTISTEGFEFARENTNGKYDSVDRVLVMNQAVGFHDGFLYGQADLLTAKTKIVKLTAQNAELLAALKSIYKLHEPQPAFVNHFDLLQQAVSTARAAIAKWRKRNE